MTVTFRDAQRADVPAIAALLADDMLGQGRETAELAPYFAAFDRLAKSGTSRFIIGEEAGEIVAACQLTFIDGMSHGGMRRAQVESVRVADRLRSRGIGALLMAEAIRRSEAAGCGLLQLTTHNSRTRAHAFYDRLGFARSHVGYKLALPTTPAPDQGD